MKSEKFLKLWKFLVLQVFYFKKILKNTKRDNDAEMYYYRQDTQKQTDLYVNKFDEEILKIANEITKISENNK